MQLQRNEEPFAREKGQESERASNHEGSPHYSLKTNDRAAEENHNT